MRLIAALAAFAAPLTALAQEAAPAAGPLGALMQSGAMPMLVIFVVFYFLLLKPQQKKMRDHAALLKALKKGDKVITSGGIYGKIVEADKDGVTTIEIASGVEIKVSKSSVSTLVDAPVAATATASKKRSKTDSIVKNDNVVLKKDQIANDN